MTNIEMWRRHLKDWTASGLAADVFAERNALSVRSLKWWRWKITTDDEKAAKAAKAVRAGAAFVEVVPAPASRSTPPSLEVLTPSGFIMRVPVGFDEETLRRLVGVLR